MNRPSHRVSPYSTIFNNVQKKDKKKKEEKLNKFVHIIISPPVLSLLCVAWIALGYESCLGALDYVFNTLASCNLPDKISVCVQESDICLICWSYRD